MLAHAVEHGRGYAISITPWRMRGVNDSTVLPVKLESARRQRIEKAIEFMIHLTQRLADRLFVAAAVVTSLQ